MSPDRLAILFSPHAVKRLKERVPQGHGLKTKTFVRLLMVREKKDIRKPLWLLRAPHGAYLLGSLRTNKKRQHQFIVRTALNDISRQQRNPSTQFVPVAVRLFKIVVITAIKEKPSMPETLTVRQQLSDLIRRNPDCDYWEKLVLRYAEVLLVEVEENLRGIPKEEAGLEKWNEEDYFNLPETIELVDGLPSPKRWNIAMEGRRRLGFTDYSQEFELMQGKTPEEIDADYARRRAELRARPFVPSPIPFPSGREDK